LGELINLKMESNTPVISLMLINELIIYFASTLCAFKIAIVFKKSANMDIEKPKQKLLGHRKVNVRAEGKNFSPKPAFSLKPINHHRTLRK